MFSLILPCDVEEGPEPTREQEGGEGESTGPHAACKSRRGHRVGILPEPRKTKNLFAGVRQLADRKGQQERFRDDKATLPNSPSGQHTLLCPCPCCGCFVDLCGTTGESGFKPTCSLSLEACSPRSKLCRTRRSSALHTRTGLPIHLEERSLFRW